MTEAFNVFDPPASDKHYGFVVGRIIRRIGDTTLDQDAYPDAANVEGMVRFTPLEKVAKSEDYKAIMFREPIHAPLDDYGFITNTSKTVRGIWLTVGLWEVAFLLSNKTLQSFVIEVTETHDEISPLDISDQKPATPIEGTPTTLLSLPAGGADGDILVKNDDGTTRWEHYLLEGVTLEDLRGPQGEPGPDGDPGSPGPMAPASAAALSENMVSNGLFEQKNNTNWPLGVFTPTTTDIPPNIGTTGYVSYPLTYGPTSPSGTFFTVNAAGFPTSPGQKYLVELWIRADKAGSLANGFIYDGTGGYQPAYKQLTPTVSADRNRWFVSEPIPTTWTKFSGVLTAGTGTVHRLGVIYPNTPGSTVTDAKYQIAGARVRPLLDNALVGSNLSYTPAVDTVDTATIKDNAITLAKMAEASVGTDELTDEAVTTAKINDGAVTSDKMDPDFLKSMQTSVATVAGYPRSVKEWGATGNNVDDDTAAFEKAIAELGQGGALFIPPGSYRITRPLTMSTDSLWMGFGANQQVLQASTTIRSEVADGPTLIANSANVERFAITGPGSTTASVGIQSKGAMLCRDMKIWDFGKGMYLDQSWYTKIERVQMRFNAVGIEANYCYNLVIDDPRISTASRANNSAGTDLYLTSGNMVNVHGGAFEGYQNAVHMDGAKQSITFFGTYFETAVPDLKNAYGILLSQGASQVNLFGTQVYLNKHTAFVGAASGSSIGSVINGIGNKFKSSADVSTFGMTQTYAYQIAPSMTALNVFGDDWWSVTHSGYSYRSGTGTGPGMYLDPYTVAPPEGGAANGVNFGGAYIGSSNNRMIALGNSGLPGSAGKSGMITWDKATKKIAVWNGSSWRDALGNAL